MKQDSETRRDERNKSLNRDSPSLPAQARQHAPAAVAELVRIIENTRSDAARLAALCIFFDRGLGKPPKPLDIAIKDRVTTRAAAQQEELERRIRPHEAISMDSLDEAAVGTLPGQHRRHTGN